MVFGAPMHNLITEHLNEQADFLIEKYNLPVRGLTIDEMNNIDEVIKSGKFRFPKKGENNETHHTT